MVWLWGVGLGSGCLPLASLFLFGGPRLPGRQKAKELGPSEVPFCRGFPLRDTGVDTFTVASLSGFKETLKTLSGACVYTPTSGFSRTNSASDTSSHLSGPVSDLML